MGLGQPKMHSWAFGKTLSTCILWSHFKEPFSNYSISSGTLLIWGVWFGFNSYTLLHCPFSTSYFVTVNLLACGRLLLLDSKLQDGKNFSVVLTTVYPAPGQICRRHSQNTSWNNRRKKCSILKFTSPSLPVSDRKSVV